MGSTIILLFFYCNIVLREKLLPAKNVCMNKFGGKQGQSVYSFLFSLRRNKIIQFCANTSGFVDFSSLIKVVGNISLIQAARS